jgi:hypothetical protein
VWISHLVKHNDGPGRIAIQNVAQEDIFQPVAFENQSLMRRIARDQTRKISTLRIFEREVFGQIAVKRCYAFARCPQLTVLTLRVVKRCLNRMMAPQPHRAGAGPARSAPALHPSRTTAQGPAWFAVAGFVHLRCSFVIIAVPLPAAPLTGKARFVIERAFPARRSHE